MGPGVQQGMGTTSFRDLWDGFESAIHSLGFFGAASSMSQMQVLAPETRLFPNMGKRPLHVRRSRWKGRCLVVKAEVTLPEKLKDLRTERKLKLADVSDAVGIPVSTLQRIEGQEDMRVGYQDVAALAAFYGVSCDYLFGQTGNRQHRHVEMDKLRLSDAAIAVLLEDGKLNHRLVSELLAHDDFPALVRALEIYIDRKVLPQMNTMNAMYKFAEQTVRDNHTIEDDDEVMALLQEAMIDEDDYLRMRISERFNDVVRSLFAAHKRDALEGEQNEALEEMRDLVGLYLDEKKGRGEGRAKVTVLAKQLGLNVNNLSDDEILVMTKVLESSNRFKQAKGQRKRKK